MPEMEYRMAQTGPQSGAALFASEERGHPVYYYDCDDIDVACARVRELGGQAETRTPVPGHGWFAACKDTEGNAFSLWQSDSAAA